MSETKAIPDEHVPSPEEATEALLPAEGGAQLDRAPTAVELGLDLPDDPQMAQVVLLRELMEARQESGELLQDVQRVAADFANYRKRVERDQVENVLRASQRVIEALLPALDSFDAALAYEPQTPAEAQLLEGMRSTHGLLLDTLAREGFEPIDASPGSPFDPAVHEAVSGPGDGDGDLVVDEEMRRGYLMRGRVIRPALVTVGHA